MYRRGRKKRSGLWLPLVSGITYKDESGTGNAWGYDDAISTAMDASMVTSFDALVPDARTPNPVTNNQDELSDAITQYGYMCRRILGQIFVGVQAMSNDSWGNIAVTCGIFVADQDAEAESLPAGVPADPIVTGLSGADAAATKIYSPDANESIGSPWMWHRQWWIQNPSSQSTHYKTFGANQNNFAFTPALKNGPWVDIKTRRHVKPGERLFLATSLRCLDGDHTSTWASTTTVRMRTNLRLYGSLTRPRRGGTF